MCDVNQVDENTVGTHAQSEVCSSAKYINMMNNTVSTVGSLLHIQYTSLTIRIIDFSSEFVFRCRKTNKRQDKLATTRQPLYTLFQSVGQTRVTNLYDPFLSV